MKLSRDDLYRLVWSMPGVAIAQAIGVSSAGFTKILRRNDIPAPGRGHWQRVAAGRKVQVKALAAADPERMLRFEMPSDLAHKLSALPSLNELMEAAAAEVKPQSGGAEAAGREAGPALRPREPKQAIPKRRGRPPGASARAKAKKGSRQSACAVADVSPRTSSRAADCPSGGAVQSQHADVVVPAFASLRDFAGCLASSRATVQLLQQLESQIDGQPAAVAAIARLWLEQAGRESPSVDLIAPFLDACRVIGAADRLPVWLLPRVRDRN